MGNIKYLEWDTSHFDLKVGECVAQSISLEDLQCLLKEAKIEGYDLVYLKCKKELDNNWLADNIMPADTRVVYSQVLCGKNNINDKHVESWLGHELSAKLLSLAIQSGGDSRYYRDKRMPLRIFLSLYHSWIVNSLNGTIASDVLVYVDNGDVLGLLTYKVEKEKVIIGLVSVDYDKSKKGIGTALMQTFLSRFPKGTRIEVTTQRDNNNACRFYEKNGFAQEAQSNTYHIWIK